MFAIPLHREEEIEKTASEVWRNAARGVIPVPTRQIFNNHGVFVRAGETGSYEAVFDMSSRRNSYTLIISPDDGTYYRYAQRVRFTEAHELGHLYLHHDQKIVHREHPTERIRKVKSGDIAYAVRENEADTFAGALLLPRAAFLKDIEFASRNIKSCARKYNVTDEAMITRFARLRPEPMVTGWAWGINGTIHSMVPSLALELNEPELAALSWRCNGKVPHSLPGRLPDRILIDLKAKITGLNVCDCASQDQEFPVIRFSEVLPTFSGPQECEVYLCGCDSGGKKIYFDLTLL